MKGKCIHMKKQEYCIGLDIGTNSTGYAMTDLKGRLLKHHKRSTFGAVLFDEANTALERRNARSARRRLDRKEQRIDLLQGLLADDIAKQDAVFFMRLNESFLQEDERKYPLLYGTLPVSIWSDGSPFIMPDGTPLLNEKSELRTYPTIYHLRYALMHMHKQADIRYIYLALHHIIKYRGHFLMEGQTLTSDGMNIKANLRDLLDQLAELLNLSDEDNMYQAFQNNDAVIDGIYSVLQSRNLSNSKRADEILRLLHPTKDSKAALKSLASLLVGNSGSLKTLFGYEGETPAEKISLSTDDLDIDGYMDVLGSNAETFELILSIYRWQLFCGLREPGETISYTMIKRYEQHQHDLQQLKAWVRAYAKDEYNHFFREVDRVNYCTYSGHYKQKRLPKGTVVKSCTQDEFYKALTSLLGSVKSPDAIRDAEPMLTAKQEDNGFLPLLRINFNGAIPNQLHAEELAMIIDNQGLYYPSLLENKEKILSLCTFRLPYYVGPLNNQSPHAKWIKRDTTVHAYPWNMFDVVNKMETAQGFIEKLTNKCTYLPKENVLPLHSLLYEEYLLLDELNRVTIKGKLIENGLKNRIISSLFMRRKNVSTKAFAKWLRENTLYTNIDAKDIEHLHGADGFAAALRTYNDFAAQGLEINAETTPMIEELVRWSTIFENRGILREKIEMKYPQLTAKQVDYVCRRRYTGWGRLSSKLLDGIQGMLNNEPATVIEIMRQTNDNFMKVINNKQYGIDQKIEAEQVTHTDGPITLDEVQALQGSPALKRGVWQAVRIVQELIEHQGHAPKAIYIENTREENDRRKGKSPINRIEILESLYKEVDAAHDEQDCKSLLAQCKAQKMRLTDRQFLYFLQLGKCLYSEKPLDFNRLDTYQIDHILPQSYIKDDSIDNRALVISSENQRKLDSQLLLADVQVRRNPWWRYLHQLKINGVSFMSDKKFRNLTRTYVSDQEQLGFINRQLVETSQIIKHVVALFKAHYPDTKVEGINARLSASVRDTYHLYKIRELNDTHHAYDAFLACTMGTFMDRYFSWISDESIAVAKARAAWLKANSTDQHHINTNGIVLGNFNRDQFDDETGEILRNAQQHIAYLKAVWGYRDHFIVYRKHQNTGEFYNQKPLVAGKAKYPLRSGKKTKSDNHPLHQLLPIERYGGYTGINPAYIAAIAYKKRKTENVCLVNVPIFLVQKYENDPSVLIDYLCTYEGFQKEQDIRIVRPKLLIGQKIDYQGNELLLKSNLESDSAKVLYLSG